MKVKKKRVLIMVNSLTGGGVERVAATQLYLLAGSNQFDVAVATCSSDAIKDVEYQTYTFHNVLSSVANKIVGTFGLGINVKEMRNCLNSFKPDIIHIHAFIHFGPAALIEILNYKQKSNCKVILTHHTFSYVCPNDSFFNYRTNKICELCLDHSNSTIVLNNCYNNIFGSVAKYMQKEKLYNLFKQNMIDVHIAPSRFMREKLLSKYPQLQIHIIYNPCLEKVNKNISKKQQGKVVYFGRISREKNVAALIRAFEHHDLEHFNLVVIGTGPAEKELEELINRSRAKKQIQFINRFVSVKELYPLIADAQFFVLPSSWYENSPVSIIESLNLGIIPIVSNHGGMKELLDITGIGYGIIPEDPDTIAHALLMARTSYDNNICTFFETIEEKLSLFTWRKYFEELVAFYKEV